MSGRDRLADFQAQSSNRPQTTLYGQQQQQPYGNQQQYAVPQVQQQYGQYGQQQQQPYSPPQQQYQQQQQPYSPPQNQYQNQNNQQQQFAQQQQSNYRQPSPAAQNIPMSNIAPANGGDINKFFSEVTAIQEDITRVEQNITRIEELHEISLNSVMSEEQASHANHQLEGITSETTNLSNRIKKRIKDIELANLRLPANSPDQQIRRTQAASLKEKFLKTLRRYQSSESEARKRYQGRMERQYKIVKPDATPQEISQVMESDNQQIFAQSILQSTRYGEANRALREVQTRHDDIKKIEKTILELHQLFMDMETLVTDQAVLMDKVEENVQQTEVHLETGNAEVAQAIVSARGARKKKWICLGISIVILLVIILIVYFQFIR